MTQNYVLQADMHLYTLVKLILQFGVQMWPYELIASEALQRNTMQLRISPV